MQELNDYEEFEEFTLVWANAKDVIDTNLYHNHKKKFNKK